MNSKMIITAIAALISMTLITSCEKIKGKGGVVTEMRSTGTYSAVCLSMSATVYLTQGATADLEITGQENIIHQIETRVEGNTLVIRVKHGVILGPHEPIKVYVTTLDVNSLEVCSSGDLFTDNALSLNEVSLKISGSGSINLANIEAENLSATISGSGSIKAASGKLTREELKISGSGTIDLRSVEASKVYTTTSGSGDIFVYATQLLDVTISGSGDTWYYGTPAVNTQISGSGNLRRM